MILTCPHCASRFKVYPHDLGAVGRKVQCSDCSHVWFALPDGSEGEESGEGAFFPEEDLSDFSAEPEELQESPPELPPSVEDERPIGLDTFENMLHASAPPSTEEIPDAVKPLPEEQVFVPPPVVRERPPLRNVLAGYGVAGAVFLVFLILFISLQGPIVRSWPPASAAYALMGRSSAVPGEGLVFDRMEAFEDNKGAFVLSGNIINLTKESKDVPMMEVVLHSQFDEVMEHWYIEPPKPKMEPEESMAFESVLERTSEAEAVRGKAADITVRFVLAVRTGAGGGDSTHAPPAGAPSHPSGGEALSESPPHASSPPHPESSPENHGEGHSPPPPPHTGGPEDHTSDSH
ncbi:MAG: zinc-ribbon domain-containing protein [Alphaproteobacteria bacterium]|nr:MAG: zinc-ribbon domain-containing protein [Alphaproteobacteria bacterium]